MISRLLLLIALLCLLASGSAFAASSSSCRSAAFTGRGGVSSRSPDLTTISPAFYGPRRSTVRMQGILNRLGFGKNKETDGEVAVVEEISLQEVSSDECIAPEDVVEKTETEKLLEQVKEAGLAGVISYALWELGFWTISVPVCIFGYREVTGHWPDFSNQEDLEKLGAEAFAFVNFARFAVPLRIGLALSTTPWIDKNIVEPFLKKDEVPVCETDDLEVDVVEEVVEVKE